MTVTRRLDAFALREEVIGTYRDYVRGFIEIADPRVAAEVDEALGSGDLWTDVRQLMSSEESALLAQIRGLDEAEEDTSAEPTDGQQ